MFSDISFHQFLRILFKIHLIFRLFHSLEKYLIIKLFISFQMLCELKDDLYENGSEYLS